MSKLKTYILWPAKSNGSATTHWQFLGTPTVAGCRRVGEYKWIPPPYRWQVRAASYEDAKRYSRRLIRASDSKNPGIIYDRETNDLEPTLPKRIQQRLRRIGLCDCDPEGE